MISAVTLQGGLVGAAALAGLALALEPGRSEDGAGLVAVRAGTIHLVEGDQVVEDGTILMRDGRIVAAGDDVQVPAAAQIVDYGPDAVIVPGLVAAHSPYATGRPSPRTAAPGLSALDGFDRYGEYVGALSGGVTSAYITPSESRLIAGQGAVVKLAGDDFERRVVNPRASIHGAIDRSARNTPGYWEPPLPATVDVGIGYQRPQLPRSTMGAIVALDELLGAARGEADDAFVEEYGAEAAAELATLLDSGLPWRLTAEEPAEIRALLRWSTENEVRLILDAAGGAAELTDEISAAGAAVVFQVPFVGNARARDHGKARDARWPRFDVPARLTAAGAQVAITGSSPRDLLFSAALASRGGLDAAAALRAITLTPAELYGVAARVGSIAPGKDGDLCVLNAAPLSGGASVVATWVDGEIAWSAKTEEAATVISVDELHVGDGHVLRPGQILIRDGKILEVAERVSLPRGARQVSGRAAMPGIIDGFGHLGLEGTGKVPSTDFELKNIVGPGDSVDRRVALGGITTVVLTPRGASKSGAPVMAYKPAAQELDRQVVADPAALRLAWTSDNRLESGNDVRELLAKARSYKEKWEEYEAAMAAWTPPPPEPEKPKEDDEKEEEGEEEEKKDDKDDDKKSKKKKKKKDEEKELEPDPVTGVWETKVATEDGEVRLRLRLLFGAHEGSGDVEGNLRCDAVSSTLVEIEGYWDRDEKVLSLKGLGSRGWVTATATHTEGKLAGKLAVGETELEFEVEQTSKEYVVAKRPDRGAPRGGGEAQGAQGQAEGAEAGRQARAPASRHGRPARGRRLRRPPRRDPRVRRRLRRARHPSDPVRSRRRPRGDRSPGRPGRRGPAVAPGAALRPQAGDGLPDALLRPAERRDPGRLPLRGRGGSGRPAAARGLRRGQRHEPDRRPARADLGRRGNDGDRRPGRPASTRDGRRRAPAGRCAAGPRHVGPANLGQRPRGAPVIAALLLALVATPQTQPADAAPGLAIRAGKILTSAWEGPQVIDRGILLIRDGKIEAVGREGEVEVPAGYDELDVGDRWLAPGFVELHCHEAGASLYSGVNDLNDLIYLANPGLRASTGVDPGNDSMKRAVAGGVTTVLYIPGSGSNIGGQGVLLKTAFDQYEKNLVRNPGSMKLAQWGNPESWTIGVGMSFEHWNTRTAIRRGKAYAARWAEYEANGGEEPAFDPSWEVFRDLSKNEIAISTHTQLYQVVLMTLTMIHGELGLPVFLDHSTIGGWLTGAMAEEMGVPAIVGPRSVDTVSRGFIAWARNKHEGMRGVAAGYQQMGHTMVGFNTDSPVIPQEELSVNAAMGARYGFEDTEMQVLRGLTIVPAKAARIGHRVGSLEVGKDADVLIVTGHPADPRTSMEMVFVDGERVYDADRDGRRW